MNLTVIIQVAIGMIFVWVTLAVITSQVQEWIASGLSWRASMLENTIERMLGNPTLKDKIYNHPLVQGFYSSQGKRKPSGIPDDKFALILLEQVLQSGVSVTDVKKTFTKAENSFEELRKSVAALKAKNEIGELKKFVDTLDTLLLGIEEKKEDVNYAFAEARKRVEGWFNDSMERLSDAYRRRAQITALVVGISIALALNVDTGAIMTTLWKDPVVRQAVVTQAGQMQESDTQTSQPPSAEEIAKNVEKLNVLSLPIGWSFKTADRDPSTADDPRDFPSSAGGWATKIVGILLSGMAAAQGAPYWFDLMRKLLSRNPPAPKTS